MTEEEIEKKKHDIILGCFNEKITLKRMLQIKIFGGLLFVLVIVSGFYFKDIWLVTIAFLVYIVITIYEKTRYGYGVLAYKRIIKMLLTEPDTLNKHKKHLEESGLIKK